jgi:hypothetical protein
LSSIAKIRPKERIAALVAAKAACFGFRPLIERIEIVEVCDITCTVETRSPISAFAYQTPFGVVP